MAPSKDKIKLTLIAKTPTKVVQIKKNIVKHINRTLCFFGLFTRDKNYFLVRKNNIGITDKFWKSIPACTTLLYTKNIFSYVVTGFKKQSKMI